MSKLKASRFTESLFLINDRVAGKEKIIKFSENFLLGYYLSLGIIYDIVL